MLVKQQQRNKMMSRFNKTPYTVVNIRGTQITAENDEHRTTRNVSHFKKFSPERDVEDHSDYECEQSDKKNVQDVENPSPPGNRRSTRTRRQPERFGTSVPSSLIT